MTRTVLPAIRQSRRFHAMGSLHEIALFGGGDLPLLDAAQKRVSELDAELSAFRPESDIARLNSLSGIHRAELGEDAYRLLTFSHILSSRSEGAFDVTIRPLAELWGIGKKVNFVPAKRDISRARRLTGYKNLLLFPFGRAAYLKRAGQEIDLGGIAKGFAADAVRKLVAETGVPSALINIGGNVVTVGPRPDGEPWRIGIQNPDAPAGEYLGVVEAEDRAVVTSGVGDRFFIKDGVRYHSVFDPRTGCPAQSGLLSVTVVAENSMEADALSTALFVLGLEDGLSLLNDFEAEAIFVREDHSVFATKGLRGHFTPFKNR